MINYFQIIDQNLDLTKKISYIFLQYLYESYVIQLYSLKK